MPMIGDIRAGGQGAGNGITSSARPARGAGNRSAGMRILKGWPFVSVAGRFSFLRQSPLTGIANGDTFTPRPGDIFYKGCLSEPGRITGLQYTMIYLGLRDFQLKRRRLHIEDHHPETQFQVKCPGNQTHKEVGVRLSVRMNLSR